MSEHQQEFKIQFEMTLAELGELVNESKVGRKYFYRIMASLLAVIAVWSFYEHGTTWPVVFVAIYAFLHSSLVQNKLFWFYMKKFCGNPVSYQTMFIDQEFITTQLQSTLDEENRTIELSWHEFTGSGTLQETKSYFLLESENRWPLSPKHHIVFPKSAFHSASELAAFKEFIVEKLSSPITA